MTATTPLLVAGDVAVGDRLPTLSYDVSATTIVLGALAARDWRPMHHDHDFAVNRNGVRDIFMNTPNQAAWFERYITDWTGPHGRLGRMTFRMRGSVFAGDTMTIDGEVTTGTGPHDVGGATGTDSHLRARPRRTATTQRPPAPPASALPSDADDNPWSRRGDDWKPSTEQRTH
ncbi:MAG: hypothetical protein U5R31_09305 [Acidimicrobiia bacterium]|nr:hypothetical protein [Acidimicrobiia bacterium]